MHGLRMNGSNTGPGSTHPATLATVDGEARPAHGALPAIEVDELRRSFGAVEALRGVSLEVRGGDIHAVLGPNGAGKTTLMRILCGLVDPSAGSAYVMDRRTGGPPSTRKSIGLVPSGDRSFYLRLSGFDNLVFFGRINGLRHRAARVRAAEVLEAVSLTDAGRRPVSTYSHGMQKRLAFARALLHDPAVLLVDEATHDLDPAAAAQVRALTTERAQSGTAVLWATQRIEELAGFAERVTVLDRGVVCFEGTVAALAAEGGGDRHVVGLGPRTTTDLAAMSAALSGIGKIQPASDAGHVLLTLAPGVSLGAALSALTAAGAEVTSCRDERPPIERAFLAVTAARAA
jgi:ABC-type multidrug transport system ATPase subunit